MDKLFDLVEKTKRYKDRFYNVFRQNVEIRIPDDCIDILTDIHYAAGGNIVVKPKDVLILEGV